MIANLVGLFRSRVRLVSDEFSMTNIVETNTSLATIIATSVQINRGLN